MPEALPDIALLVLFCVLHLLAGALLPYRTGRDPFFWRLIRNAGLEIHRRLNRPGRNASELFVRGVVVVGVMGAFACLIAAAFVDISTYPYGWVGTLVLLFLVLSVMPYLKVMQKILKLAVTEKDTQKSADVLRPFLIVPLEKPDTHAIIRETLGLAAVRLNQYLIAPCLFFLLLGTFGLVLYVTFAALHDAFGTQDIFFGGMIRVVDKLFNFFPALLTTALVCLAAAFVSRSSPLSAAREAMKQNKERLWIIGAFAGALGITLGQAGQWIGAKESSARVTPEDLKRGTMLYFVVFLFTIVLLSVVIMALYKFS